MGAKATGGSSGDDPFNGLTWSGQSGDPFAASAPADPFAADPFPTGPAGGFPTGQPGHVPSNPDPFIPPQATAHPLEGQATGRKREGGGLTPTWIAAGATLLAAVIGAVVVLLQPDTSVVHMQPGAPIIITAAAEPADEASGTLLADISDVQLSTPNPCCDWAVQMDVQGFAGRSCVLEAEVLDLVTGEKYEKATSAEAVIQKDRDRASFTMSLSLPPGQYQVMFLIRDDQGLELDRVTSAPFSTV